MKQETLEEALSRFKEEHTVLNLYPSNILQNIAEFGAKWQQERMYSEEEMISFAEWILKRNIEELKNSTTLSSIRLNSNKSLLREWFEQYKKK